MFTSIITRNTFSSSSLPLVNMVVAKQHNGVVVLFAGGVYLLQLVQATATAAVQDGG